MMEHGTLQTAQVSCLKVRTLLVTVRETEAMCTNALMRNGYGTRKGTETIGLLVKENGHETLIAAITTIGDQQRKSLNELVTGQNTSALREKNITTIANQKSLNGRSLATGSIGKRTKNTSVTGNVTGVIGIVIVNESTTDNLTQRLATVVVVPRKDIPILVDLVLCRIVTTVVVAAMWHLLVQQRIAIIIELIGLSHQCRSNHNLEDTAMV